MKSKIVILIAALVLLSPVSILVANGYAEHPHGEAEHPSASAEKAPETAAVEQPSAEPAQEAAVTVNNALCPVSGENVMAMGGGYKHEHGGKIYNLCCPGCVSTFESDPAKYSKIAEEGQKL